MTQLMQFPAAKARGEKLTLLTCYDSYTAAILQASEIDALLVGDSLAMVVYGEASTLTADLPRMAAHTRAVRAGAPELPIIADMPFLTTRCGLEKATEQAGLLMQAGADGVKIEGLTGHEEIIPHLVASGIPVMGHIGLTPQSVHTLGGYRVQGRGAEGRERLNQEAQALQELGCFALVAECIPGDVGAELAALLAIPVIGIGAGSGVDGQILVLQDLLGLSGGHRPRFVRSYMDGAQLVGRAVDGYIQDVRRGDFPSPAESYLFADVGQGAGDE